MQQMLKPDGHDLIHALKNIDDVYDEEKKIFSAAIRNLLSGADSVTSKDVLFYLIAEMEATTDVIRLDVLRTCLEILLGLNDAARVV
ncbi:biofilm development regulator YmgB/AriR family protein [[Curtobacterium] plantarum]|uniref:biofilm development regulator YmgB/AriR family protein n=1 Tax=[Curtobacterium] plantarum TaxID=221276 RepID=UPI000F08206A|nr:biofilm development regulator YmgB/AriR family protein [[Curtobacterium] plantarum]RNA76563.1 hypothetical protein EBO33_13095 [[Curtobacterium] plantarum]